MPMSIYKYDADLVVRGGMEVLLYERDGIPGLLSRSL